MAQTATAEARHKFVDEQFEQFPIHYERGYLQVYTNPSGELFVEDTQSGISMRISLAHPAGLQFTTVGRVEPVRVTNMIGWLVEPR